MGVLDSQLSVKMLVILSYQLILTDLILSYQLKVWPILSYQLLTPSGPFCACIRVTNVKQVSRGVLIEGGAY